MRMSAILDQPTKARVRLHCQIGDHDWYRDSQRGKRPLNCPEHAIKRDPVTERGTDELWCEEGQHKWERTRTKGTRPTNCPQHRPVKRKTDRSAASAKGAETRARERQEQEQEKHAQELIRLREALPVAERKYEEAFARACTAKGNEIERAFNKADQYQSQVIFMSRRVRSLIS